MLKTFAVHLKEEKTFVKNCSPYNFHRITEIIGSYGVDMILLMSTNPSYTSYSLLTRRTGVICTLILQ